MLQKNFLAELTDDDISRLPAELAHDPLEAGLLADLGGAVDILHREEGPQPEQQDLRQGGH